MHLQARAASIAKRRALILYWSRPPGGRDAFRETGNRPGFVQVQPELPYVGVLEQIRFSVISGIMVQHQVALLLPLKRLHCLSAGKHKTNSNGTFKKTEMSRCCIPAWAPGGATSNVRGRWVGLMIKNVQKLQHVSKMWTQMIVSQSSQDAAGIVLQWTKLRS